MALPTELDHCPRTPECQSRLLYVELAPGQAEWKSGDPIYYVDAKRKFLVHKCNTSRASVKPEYVYLAEFKNNRTGRVRWIGPFRTRGQAETSPKDDKTYAAKRGESEWTLVETFVSRPLWKKAPPKKD